MFKLAFKHYKQKNPPPDLQEVIDFDTYESQHLSKNSYKLVKPLNISDMTLNQDPLLPLLFGMKPQHSWRCYRLTNHPGLLIIRNPFTLIGQRYWIARSLRDYPRAPNILNLDKNNFSAAAISDWWSELQKCKDGNVSRRLKVAMRWTTIGYHHNWTTKIYDEMMHTKFPSDLSSGITLEDRPTALFLRSGDVLIMSDESRLCYHAVPRVLKTHMEPWSEQYNINEREHKIAGITAKNSMDLNLYDQVKDDTFWRPFNHYINDSRININVRQVLPTGASQISV